MNSAMPPEPPADSVSSETAPPLHYPFDDRYGDRTSNPHDTNGMYLKDPANIKESVEYDPENNRYNINERMGDLFYRNPSYMSF